MFLCLGEVMARALQLLSSVLSRTTVLCPRSTFTSSRCRCISKGPNFQPWTRPSLRAPRLRDEDGGHELEDMEDKIQEVISKEILRRKTVRYHILKRKMTPRGPPERKLTWDAIEEVRYLKREQPEEWTVERLAKGFSVSEDVILRVLRSKFAPNPERKAKQDARVTMQLKQQMLPSGPRVELEKQRLASSLTQPSLSSGNVNSALIPVSHQSLQPQTEQNPAALSVVNKHQFSERTESWSTDKTQVEMQQSTQCPIEEEQDEYEGWDGQVLSEEDIEQLGTVKASPVIQKGSEIFDVDGNLLYRI